MSLSDSEKKIIDTANRCEKIQNADAHVYKYDVGNNVHLQDGKMPHDFSKKIDLEGQIEKDLASDPDKQRGL